MNATFDVKASPHFSLHHRHESALFGPLCRGSSLSGINFVREDHLVVGPGCFLPRADLLGDIEARLHPILFQRPDLKPYLPRLLDVDLFLTWDGDKFLLFVSPEKRGHLPARGIETKSLPLQREQGNDFLRNLVGFTDVSDLDSIKEVFEQLGFTPGFAAAGTYPASLYSDEAKALKRVAGEAVANLMKDWAEERRSDVENSRIFLSHKGINKPLIDKIDRALRLINLKTWFDRDDLNAGDPLVRGVHGAFDGCAAAVFFISADYEDAGVIKQEIDRATHEQAMRPDGFKTIPLVLAQHGGTDALVPAPLKTLVWKTVDDADIVPTIIKALPPKVQALIRYSPPK